MQTPAWAPGSVGSAYRHPDGDADDLVSGRAWAGLLDALGRAGRVLEGDRVPKEPVDQAAGYRHLLVLLALGIDEALRAVDPYDPVFAPANVDNVLKWGMDCPDAAYTRRVHPRGRHLRVRGRRNTVRYLGFQIMGGMTNTGNVVADDLALDDDGRFELVLSADEHPGNWIALDPQTSSLVVRQFFYDWTNERAAELTIECTDRPSGAAAAGSCPRPLDAAGVAAQLEALGCPCRCERRVLAGRRRGRAGAGGQLLPEAGRAHPDGGGGRERDTWGSWSLADDECLLIEVAPPEALYWSVSLGNYWWETIDYAATSVEPQRPPGRTRRRRRVPGRRRPPRSGRGQLARHRRQPPRRHDLPLAAAPPVPPCPRSVSSPPGRAGRRPRGPPTVAHRSRGPPPGASTTAPAPCAGASPR